MIFYNLLYCDFKNMVDLERRKFIKLGLKLVTTGTVLAATYPKEFQN